MVSVIHSINAAFGVSNKFVPYRPSWDVLTARTTPTTFAINPQPNFTIQKVDTRKMNGMAWISVYAVCSVTIPASTTTTVALVAASAAKIGNAAVHMTGHIDTMIANRLHAWMSAGTTQELKVASELDIPAGISISITGSYLCQ